MATTNQIAYWKMMNEDRHYRAQEAETHRSNVAQETETTRANLARESETARNNRVNNLIAYDTLEEQHRSNLAREQETYRANRSREMETEMHNEVTEWQKEIELNQKYWNSMGTVGSIAGLAGFAMDQAWNNPRKNNSQQSTSQGGVTTRHENPNTGTTHTGTGGKFK